MTAGSDVGAEFLRSARLRLESLKTLGDQALVRLDDGDLTKVLDPESNSVAVLVQVLTDNRDLTLPDMIDSDGIQDVLKTILHLALRLRRISTKRWTEVPLDRSFNIDCVSAAESH